MLYAASEMSFITRAWIHDTRDDGLDTMQKHAISIASTYGAPSVTRRAATTHYSTTQKTMKLHMLSIAKNALR